MFSTEGAHQLDTHRHSAVGGRRTQEGRLGAVSGWGGLANTALGRHGAAGSSAPLGKQKRRPLHLQQQDLPGLGHCQGQSRIGIAPEPPPLSNSAWQGGVFLFFKKGGPKLYKLQNHHIPSPTSTLHHAGNKKNKKWPLHHKNLRSLAPNAPDPHFVKKKKK